MCWIIFFRTFQKRIERIHGAVVDGDIDVLEALLKRRNLAISKDDNGHGILHKAVFHGHREIVEWLCDKYPETMELKDWVSTTYYIVNLAIFRIILSKHRTKKRYPK